MELPDRIDGAALEARGWYKMVYLAVPLAFFMAMFFLFPFRQRFEFDLDEGLNLMKALLVARGYPLYTQVWSDQPPLLTYVLAAGLRAFGANVDAARCLVLLFSTILMAAASHTLRISWGWWHALAGALIILILPFYTSMSVAVMVGLPAISLAVVSVLAQFTWHKRRQKRWLALSAILLGLSVLTKLFTGLIAPLFVLGILLEERTAPSRPARLRMAVLWCLIFGTFTATLALILVGPANLGQLVTTHLFARQDSGFIGLANSQSITWHLRDSWPVLFLAGVGSLFVILERRWTSLYLLAWGVLAYMSLSFHAPVWYHHQFLITIPAAMLAGIAVGETARLLPKIIREHAYVSLRALLLLLALAGFAATLAVRARLTYHTFILPAQLIPPEAASVGRETPFLLEMESFADRTHWVVTDLPMYAFRAGLLVPPPLAAITDKRLSSGEITEAQIMTVIEAYHPEMVLWGRFKLNEMEEHLRDDYRVIYRWGRIRLYVLRDLDRIP